MRRVEEAGGKWAQRHNKPSAQRAVPALRRRVILSLGQERCHTHTCACDHIQLSQATVLNLAAQRSAGHGGEFGMQEVRWRHYYHLFIYFPLTQQKLKINTVKYLNITMRIAQKAMNYDAWVQSPSVRLAGTEPVYTKDKTCCLWNV